MSLIYFFFAVFQLILCVWGSAEHVPVLLWSKNNLPAAPSLRVASSLTFIELLHDALEPQSPMVVVFLEDDLSNEDFSVPAQDGKPINENLVNTIEKDYSLYLPSVVSPMKAIGLLEAEGYERVRYGGKVPVDLKKPSVIMVPLHADSSKDRSSVLQEHFDLVEKIYSQMTNAYSNVLAVYTGRRSSWSSPDKILQRVRRADEPPKEPASILLMKADKFVAIARGIVLKQDDTSEPVTVTGVVSVTAENGTADSSQIKVTFSPSGELTLNVVTSSQQWALSEVQMGGKRLVAREEIWAPSGWSWACNRSVVFSASPIQGGPNADFKGSVIITGFQAQPNVNDNKFGQAMDCVPYFSSAIWTGIVISFLLLSILSWGLMMLMDINTNDRFDDPKGKTITINATD